MIAPDIVERVQQLLAENKLSQRKIAKLTGVSRGTVGAIACGKRPLYKDRPNDWLDSDDRPSGPPRRCPSCGSLAYLPCRLCEVRRRTDATSRSRRLLQCLRPEVSLELELREEHRQRYEWIREQRHLRSPQQEAF